MAKASRAKTAMGGGSKKDKKKKGKKAHKMSIRRSANGGYIAENHYQPEQAGGAAPEPEEHALPDMDSLLGHVSDHMAPPAQEGQQEPVQA